MYKYLSLLLLLLTGTVSAQNKGNIKGKITDSISKAPVEFATVAVLNATDTTNALIAYTLSDKDGMFALHNLPRDIKLKILISFVDYRAFRKTFSLNKAQAFDFGTIEISPRQLNEVTITGERMPIVIRKDTIEFDAEAFKTRPNAVVEDLLKKLPGIEVANDGTITVMAKHVSKVLVDGREFFASDPRIATKNLDADMIAKVQVYDDRENDPDHLVPDVKVDKIINLKFKKALKKSIFGKMYAGSGTQNHYQAGGLFNMFRDTLQVSMLGSSNDLNSTGFDFNDLYNNGGLNRGGNLGFGYGSGVGKQTATTAGINIKNDYGKILKLNLSYVYKHANTSQNNIINQQQFLSDTTVNTGSVNDNRNTTDSHAVSGLLRWNPNNATILIYNPVLDIYENSGSGSNLSNSYSNFINPISNSANSSHSSGNNLQFRQNLNFNRQLKKKGASFSITHNLSINPGDNTNYNVTNYQSYIASFPSYILQQLGSNQNKTVEAGISADYRYPFSKTFTASINAETGFDGLHSKASMYNYDPFTGAYDVFLQDQSSDLTRNQWTQTIKPGVTWRFLKEANLQADLAAQWQQVNNRFDRNSPDIDQRFFFLLPAVSLNFKSISVGYNKGIRLPNIGDMIPYSVVFSPLYSVKGNPGLKPAFNNSFNISYSNYNFQTGNTYYLNGGAWFEQNGVFRQRTVDEKLVETSTPINRDGRYNYHLGGSFTRRFKKRNGLQFSTSPQLNLGVNHDFFVINHRDGFQDTYNVNFTERMSLNWKDIIEIDPQYTIYENYTVYKGINYSNRNYLSHNVDAHFNIYWPSHTDLECYYTYHYNPLVPEGFQKSSNLLSLSLARQVLKKDRGEIKLSCYDIFNQNIGFGRSINQNIISDSQSEIIKRYFLLTLQFKFNKATLKNGGRHAAGS